MKNEQDTTMARAKEFFAMRLDQTRRHTDRLLAQLMVAQWIFAIFIAAVFSPYAWEGLSRTVHPHVFAAVFLGATISSFPLLLVWLKPGAAITRYTIAVAQMLWSALLIHLTGGRIETHFHIFGSLAFLAFYRDWRVLVPATLVVAGDHLARQLFWPESVYGVANPEWWRFLEHAGWVVFEDVFLVLACLRSNQETWSIAVQRAELENASEHERERSAQLDWALREALAAKNAAEVATQVKSRFLANMSHELRTPINGVMGMAEIMSRTSLSSKQRQYIGAVRASGETLLRVVNDILDFSKVEAGKLELDEHDFDLRDVVQRVMSLQAISAHGKGVELVYAPASDMPRTVLGDSGRLEQVLNNLVTNAIKFTKDGEVVVRARLMETLGEEATVRFEVIDTGLGISEADQARLFQAFSQVDGSNSRKYGGTGLGLAIAKQLVQMMGGEIGIQSEPGKGSTFWFTVRFRKWSRSRDSIHVPDHLRGARVLILDDNETSLSVLREHIVGVVAHVDVATNADSALASLSEAAEKKQPYGLVISDMQMPAMDGLAFIRALRALPAYAKTPVVLLTSLQQPTQEEIADGRISACLAKPVRAEGILECVPASFDANTKSHMNMRFTPSAQGVGGEREARSLLIAEDNPVNQQVALEMLMLLGYKVEIVNNGKEAVDAVARSGYDVVLMDCQMPEMDGYEATAEIRRRETEGSRIPIIAVTAHALPGEREKALAVGMDDYLTKPLSLDELARAIEKWIPGGGHARTESASDPETEAVRTGVGILDPTVHRSKRVIELVLGQLSQFPGRALEAFASGDFAQMKVLAHKFKGSCGSIGAERMAKLCADIEVTPEHARDLLKGAENDIATLKEKLEEELATRYPTEPAARIE